MQAALASDSCLRDKHALLEQHGLRCFAIVNHLVGQGVCDLIDERHQSILSEAVWGDGDPEGVRPRAAKEMQDTARAAAKFGVKTVTGFTGSSVWHANYAFPPTTQACWDKHGLQCGFCTPGRIMTAYDLINRNPKPTEAEVRHGIEGTMCRCTGYQNIVAAVREAATRMKG